MVMTKETIEGTLTEIRFHKDNFLIGRLNNGIAVKGTMTAPQLGMEYRFQGKWTEHPRWGKSFAFSSYTRSAPKSLPAIQAYLEQNSKWVGPETARKIIQAFGETSLEILKNEPERVAHEIPGITTGRALEISAMLKKAEAHEALEIALNEIFDNLPVSARIRHKIIDRWGSEAPDRIKKDPYQLIEAIGGIGFLTADRIAKKVGFEPEGYPRLRAGVLHALGEAAWSGGHTFLPREALIRRAQELLCVAPDRIIGALAQMSAEGPIVAADADNIYLRELYAAETGVAEKLRYMGQRHEPLP